MFGLNELLWIGLLFINYGLILLAYRLWGKVGMFMCIPISIILANVQIVKMMVLFGVDTPMGNIAYGGVFLISDILSEIYGKKAAKSVIGIGFFTMVFMTIVMQFVLRITISPLDTGQNHLEAVFGVLPRLMLASICAFVISQRFDIWLYQFVRRFRPSYQDIWIRNNASTILSQMLDNIIFTLIAFVGVYSWETLVVICVSTYILKIIISILDTPFVYIAARLKQQNKVYEIDHVLEEELHYGVEKESYATI